MLWKCCTQYASNLENSAVTTGMEKISFHANPKECSNYRMIALCHMPGRLCSRSFKLGFSGMWTVHFQMYKLDLEKAEESEIKLPASVGSYRKQGSSRKTSTSGSLTMQKPLIVSITRNCGQFWKRWEYQTTWPASWETYMLVRKQQLELDMEQQTGSK